MEVRIITCGVRRNVRTWAKLERPLLLAFRQKYGAIPMCNRMGKKMRQKDEFECSKRERVERILGSLA